jgi:hypothetical protein
MRYAPLLGGLTAALALAGSAAAQNAPDVRVVTAPQAEVRAGPSTDAQLYPTNVLRRGDRVEVLEEMNGGWLKIRPPAGSFSWINTRFVENIIPRKANYVVIDEQGRAPVLVGSSLRRERPTVAGTYLVRGTQVRSIGPAQTDSEGSWLPIEPPDTEVRYIQQSAVARSTAPAASPSGGVPVVAGAFVAGSVGAAAAPAAPPDPDALWRGAQQAERAGRIDEAIRLYRQAGTANLSVNAARAQEALDRANWLAARGQAAGAPASPYAVRDVRAVNPGGEARYAMSPADGRITPVPPASGPVPVQFASGAGGPPPYQVVCTSEGAVVNLAGVPTDTRGMPTSGPGRLRRAGRCIESQRTYVLEFERGGLLYVLPQPGLDLEAYVNRHVELFGPITYRGDLRANAMNVCRVQPLP